MTDAFDKKGDRSGALQPSPHKFFCIGFLDPVATLLVSTPRPKLSRLLWWRLFSLWFHWALLCWWMAFLLIPVVQHQHESAVSRTDRQAALACMPQLHPKRRKHQRKRLVRRLRKWKLSKSQILSLRFKTRRALVRRIPRQPWMLSWKLFQKCVYVHLRVWYIWFNLSLTCCCSHYFYFAASFGGKTYKFGWLWYIQTFSSCSKKGKEPTKYVLLILSWLSLWGGLLDDLLCFMIAHCAHSTLLPKSFTTQ